MDYNLIISLVSGMFSALSFFASKKIKKKACIWGVFISIATALIVLAVYNQSELQRIKDIHRQASVIESHYSSSSYNKEFIQEVLVFLDENKAIYTQSYERANQIYSDMKNSTIEYDFDAAIELHGIIKGIVAMNKN